MPAPVQIAAVQLWSTRAATPDDNRRHALDMLERAARDRPDLVVLPEAVAMLCYPDDHPDFTYFDVTEAVPGATSDAACQIAKEYGVNIVIGLIERRASGGQNLALVIDRDGAIVGRYEKIHEPEICRLEQNALVGNDVPVFDLDFGRIGVFICWDLNYPELPSLLARKGADLLVFPHLISLASCPGFAARLRARAIDAGLPLVASGMRDPHNHNGTQDGMGATCVLNAEGSIVAQTLEAGPDIVTATTDLETDGPNRNLVERSRKDARPEVYVQGWSPS